MNPVSVSSLVVIVLALVAGLVIGLVLARSRTRAAVDAALADQSLLNFHPLVNTRTTTIATADLIRFLRATGHEPLILDPRAPG